MNVGTLREMNAANAARTARPLLIRQADVVAHTPEQGHNDRQHDSCPAASQSTSRPRPLSGTRRGASPGPEPPRKTDHATAARSRPRRAPRVVGVVGSDGQRHTGGAVDPERRARTRAPGPRSRHRRAAEIDEALVRGGGGRRAPSHQEQAARPRRSRPDGTACRQAAVDATIQSTSARANHTPPPRWCKPHSTVSVFATSGRASTQATKRPSTSASPAPSTPGSHRCHPATRPGPLASAGTAQNRSAGVGQTTPRPLVCAEAGAHINGHGATRGTQLDEPEQLIIVRGEVSTASSNVHAQHEQLRTDFFKSVTLPRGEVDDGSR